jgi:hypothetical protein
MTPTTLHSVRDSGIPGSQQNSLITCLMGHTVKHPLSLTDSAFIMTVTLV